MVTEISVFRPRFDKEEEEEVKYSQMSLWQEKDKEEISVAQQVNIAERLGLTLQEAKDDPEKFRRACLKFLLGRVENNAIGDENLSQEEQLNFRENIVALTRVMRGK